jgi:hypothetical protein
MLEVFNFPQGSEAWDEIRRSKLTASCFDKVFSSKSLRMATLDTVPSDNELAVMLKRAKKQAEVVSILKDGDVETKDLNASGLKGLTEKGHVSVYENQDGCAILTSSAEKHIDLLIAQSMFTPAELGEKPPTDAMERGNELEDLARIEFEQVTGVTVDQVGFCMDGELSAMIGCSPDGLVEGRTGGFEAKCPLPQTHIGYLRKNRLPLEYKAQVHGCMAVTGADHWWFTSYCPQLPPLILKINRSKYTENLRESLKAFDAMYQTQLQELKLEQ